MREIERNYVATVVAYVGWLVTLLHIYATWVERAIPSPRIEREEVRRELIRRIQTDERSCDILRMGSNAFGHLVNILRATGLLRDTKYSCVEEQVMKFLHILSHNVRNRTIAFFFIAKVRQLVGIFIKFSEQSLHLRIDILYNQMEEQFHKKS